MIGRRRRGEGRILEIEDSKFIKLYNPEEVF
jgi:hypothetical protein